MARPRAYLNASKAALASITRLYDFVWPTAAALWNLRWQVAGYNDVRGGASVEELQARFVEGSKIHGANLHRACLELTWEEQQERLAEVLLINLFAVYESWLAQALEELAFTKAKRKYASENLQFPTDNAPNAKKPGIGPALALLTSPESAPLKADLYPVACAAPLVHVNMLDDLLLIYRYFKEVRNSLVHDAGMPGPFATSAYSNLGLVPSNTPFSMPTTVAIQAGSRVKTDLRGVVGFGDIIRRIIFTLEAELLRSTNAEELLAKRWAMEREKVRLEADPLKRHEQLRRFLKKFGFPAAASTGQVVDLLKAKGLA